MNREPPPDPVLGWADMVGFVPSDQLREDPAVQVKARPKRTAKAKGYAVAQKVKQPPKLEGWTMAPQFQPYGDYEGLLVRTVLLRSDKYPSIRMLPLVKSPQDIATLCRHVGYYDQEHIVVLSLDGSNNVLAILEIAIGQRSSAQVELNHTMKVPLLTGASAIAIVHNHPSGDPRPSRADLELTERIRVGLACLGLQLLDHVIVSHGDYVSFVDRGLI